MNNYFYINRDGDQIGPLSIREIKEKRCLLPETMVWTESLTDWKKAIEVEELSECFQILPSSPPPSTVISNSVNNLNNNNTPVKPETWLVWNILATILCCLVTGVIGIIYSNKADSLWAAGKYDDANNASKIAKNMFILSICLAAIVTVIYIILGTFGVVSSMESMNSFSL